MLSTFWSGVSLHPSTRSSKSQRNSVISLSSLLEKCSTCDDCANGMTVEPVWVALDIIILIGGGKVELGLLLCLGFRCGGSWGIGAGMGWDWVGWGWETRAGRNWIEMLKSAGMMNLDPGGFWLLSSWLESRLVGKSKVVGDKEQEWWEARMVGEEEQEQPRAAKVGAWSKSREGLMRFAKLVQKGNMVQEEGKTEWHRGLWDEGAGTGGVARELGSCPRCAVNWPFLLHDGKVLGGM